MWTSEKLQKLIELYPGHTNREIAQLTGWNYTDILNKSKNLGLKKHPSTKSRSAGKIKVSPKQLQFIRDNYETMTNEDLARALGFRITKTREFLYSLGLKRIDQEYWTEEQIEFLNDNYRHMGDTELAERFNSKWIKKKGWTKKHIEKKRRYLKLKRTAAEIKAIRQGWTDKGLYVQSVRKMWETRGSRPLGSIVWWNHARRLIPHIKTENGYIQYARHRYIELHGEIAPGYNVVFVDNNSQNISDENLALRPDSEMALINSGAQNLTDNYVLGIMTQGQPKLRENLKEYPEIIELKRQQLLLQREINNGKKKNVLGTGNAG